MTLNLCGHSSFAWSRDVGGNLCNQFGFEKMSPVCCQILNVQGELMFFLMYVMPVEIKLLMSLNCEVICYLPKWCMLVVYPRYGVWIGFFSYICHQVAALLSLVDAWEILFLMVLNSSLTLILRILSQTSFLSYLYTKQLLLFKCFLLLWMNDDFAINKILRVPVGVQTMLLSPVWTPLGAVSKKESVISACVYW